MKTLTNQIAQFDFFIQLKAQEVFGYSISSEQNEQIKQNYNQHGLVIVYIRLDSEDQKIVIDTPQLQLLGNDKKHYDATKNARYKFRYFLGKALIKQTLGICLGRSTDTLNLEYGSYGKPFLSGAAEIVDFNLSHTQDLIILAVTKLGRIGIDIESSDREIETLSIAKNICTDFELKKVESLPKNLRNRFLLRLWTLKEAFSKSLGLGLYKPFTSFGIRYEASQFQLIELEETEEDSGNWLFFSEIFQENYRLSIALEYQ